MSKRSIDWHCNTRVNRNLHYSNRIKDLKTSEESLKREVLCQVVEEYQYVRAIDKGLDGYDPERFAKEEIKALETVLNSVISSRFILVPIRTENEK